MPTTSSGWPPRFDAERVHWIEELAPFRLQHAVFVADAPIDDSVDVLEGLKEHYVWLDVVTLSRNFGQHPATIAGVLHSNRRLDRDP